MAVAVETDELEVQRDRLLGRLADQRERLGDLWDWYRGRQAAPDVPRKYRAMYQLLLDSSVTPWARLVVDAIAERLRVQGVRAEDDREAAGEAWDAFQRSRLDADQRLIYVEALIGGTGYVSVAPQQGEEARITPESAFEVAHEPNPADRQVVAAALKLYPLDYSRVYWICELYRPEATWRWVGTADRPTEAGVFPIDRRRRRRRALSWELLDSSENGVGVVPVVPFENRIDVLSGGASEIEDCVPILRRLDRLTLDALVASHYSAFRQKWATGLVLDQDPETGEKIDEYKLAVDRLWTSAEQGTRFGTFEQTDISGGYLQAVDSEIAKLASISRVPAHYLMQRNLANPPTAESLIAGETGLTSKVEDRQGQYGEAWEQSFWLQAQLSGRDVEIETFEVLWRSAEKRNPAQVADAAIKWQAMGVPQPALWAYGGFSPQQVEEWRLELGAKQLLEAAAAEPEPAALPTPEDLGVPPGGQPS